MIQINNLSYTRQGKEILKDVSLSVPQGRTMVIMGPSGCGKSTLLRLVMGLVEYTGGQISLAGLPNKEFIQKKNSSIGMIFQSSALFDSLTVFENVAFGLFHLPAYKFKPDHAHTELIIKEKVQKKLKHVGLGEDPFLLTKYPSELSGGMQKRVAIARTLILEPDIVLYDEPTTGLDPITARTINELIRKTQIETEVTSLVVTHDLKTALYVGDEIGFLFNGNLIECGPAESIIRSQHPLLRDFLESARITE